MTMNWRNRLKAAGRRRRSRGIALATVIILTLIVALLGGAILFSSQLETLSANNFNLQMRSFYAADAGLQMANNWFSNSYASYCETAGNPCAGTGTGVYDCTSAPVLLASNGKPVTLDATAGGTSNYPDSTVASSFTTALGGTSGAAVGSSSGRFWAKATLLSVRPTRGLNSNTCLESWKVKVTGAYAPSGAIVSKVQLASNIQQSVSPLLNYAMFSTSATCKSLQGKGGIVTNSYDSSLGTYATTVQNTQGDIGSNGNIYINGSVTIGGNVSVPGGKTGTCGSPAGDLTTSGGASKYNSIVNLKAPQSYPPPYVPPNWSSIYPATTVNTPPAVMTGCPDASTLQTDMATNAALPLGAGCYYGDLTVSGRATITFPGGTGTTPEVYFVNSITLVGGSQIVISPSGPVILDVVGQGQTTPIDLSGGSVTNLSTSGNPAPSTNFIVEYGGTRTVKVDGNAAGAMITYAPNAAVDLTGTNDYYGTIIGATVNDGGGVGVHFDRSARNTLLVLGQPQLVSWNRTVN
jgi:Tfp pilus assembly protein PilX